MNDEQSVVKPRLLLVGIEGLEHWTGRRGFDVVGIVDLYGEWPAGKPSELHKQLRDCPLFADVAEAIAAVSPHIACISVPGGGKTPIAATELLLAQGIDVLAKKLRLSAMADVLRLKDVCRANTAAGTLYVGEPYRYRAPVLAIERLLAAGRLGEVFQVTWRCRLPYEVYEWMKGYRHLALEDLAYHHFGVLHALFGFDPVRLYADSYEPGHSRTGSRTVASVLAATERYRLHYELVWCSRRQPYGYFGDVTVEGAEGTAVFTDHDARLYTADGAEQALACPAGAYDGPWGLLDHWLDTAGAGTRSGSHAAPAASAMTAPFTFAQFEPVLRAIYRAVESAETFTVQ